MGERHYPASPIVGVGAVVQHGGRVLLVQRRRPPAQGEWAIPGGRVRLGETLQRAAEREVLEEAGLRIRAGRPIYAFDLVERDETGQVRFHYVVVDVEAEYLDGALRPGDDALDVRWCDRAALASLALNANTRSLLREVLHLL